MACPCALSTCNECNPCVPNPCNEICSPPPMPTCEDECEIAIYSDQGCASAPNDNCISYTGPDNSCVGIIAPMTIKDVIVKITSYLKNIFNNLTSNSLLITRSGNPCNSSATIEIIPSANAGNSFILGTDNKAFVPKTNIASGLCISFTKTIVNGIITFTPVLDINCISNLICPICKELNPPPAPCVNCGETTNLVII